MDTDLLKTFLTVEREGQFGRAAERLYLTPAAVSARIRQLEGLVGVPLFIRSRTRVSLTPAGERLKPHAERILASWSEAIEDTAFAGAAAERFALGGTPNLWDLALQDYLPAVAQNFPNLLLRAESHDSQLLTTRLLARQLDMALLFDPLKADEFGQVAVFDISLSLVSTRPGLSVDQAFGSDYVIAEWSNDFSVKHQRLAGRMPQPRLTATTGRIALNYLLSNGGSAFLPDSTTRGWIDTGRLHAVGDAPSIEQRVFAVFRSDHRQIESLQALLDDMRSSLPYTLTMPDS